MKKLLLLSAVFMCLSGPLSAAGPEDGLFNAAKTMIANAQSMSDEEKIASYRAAKDLLDLVKSSYGSSEIGQGIIAEGVVQGIDIGALNNVIESGSLEGNEPVLVDLGDTIVTNSAPTVAMPVETIPIVATTPTSEAADSPSPIFLAPSDEQGTSDDEIAVLVPLEGSANELVWFPPSNAESETALSLDKQAIRDIQARLLVLGHDPNGIDGVIGRGVRSAVKGWQESRSADANGYLNETQVIELRKQSQAALDAWLEDPENALEYLPPPPKPIGPYNMSGTWRFTSNCGSKSRLGRMKIKGVLSIAHSNGNLYSGRARNSQGFNGKFTGRLSGRRMTGEINWGLLVGKVIFRGTVADQKLVINGRDNNGCSFYAAKSG